MASRYLGDSIERKPVLFWFAVIATPLPLVYLVPTPFTVVIILSVYGSITGTLLGPAGSAFGADCLPRDKNGKPTDPSRDTALSTYAVRQSATGSSTPCISTQWRMGSRNYEHN